MPSLIHHNKELKPKEKKAVIIFLMTNLISPINYFDKSLFLKRQVYFHRVYRLTLKGDKDNKTFERSLCNNSYK